MNVNSKRGVILTAASLIIRSQGVEKLTLEAVAREAGVSKGGLLHHFPNKNALIQGLVEELTDGFVTDVQERAAASAVNEGKWSRAYTESVACDIKDGNGISTALSAALFSKPELLEKLQEQYALWQKDIENDGIDPVRSTIVRLAADGLWFSEMFSLGKLDAELREQVIQELLKMTV
ncbi:TetR/AcrR family transcriptional regulator [Paenibacillus typhae]|uniref:Transcriptional regulator, TetR family n=1 Tax=Paenibacillus typhae TaxID=1174501 RepID=A0A1G8LEX0_9BACL|nr:TetR/AcrR family transcriptional regulator [Paenibacillus typhae]SDI54183.1 transcriptional regulator, TetR family [Paenibacillus typhae]